MKILLAAAFLSLATSFVLSGKPSEDVPKSCIVVIKTTKGDAKFELFPSVAPVAVSAFLLLAGHMQYDERPIKNVVPDHHILFDAKRLEDWTSRIDLESAGEAGLRHSENGLLCYPKQNLRTNQASAFVMLQAHPWLSDQFIAFGKVISGMPALEALQGNDSVLKVEIENRDVALAFAMKTLGLEPADSTPVPTISHPGFHAP